MKMLCTSLLVVILSLSGTHPSMAGTSEHVALAQQIAGELWRGSPVYKETVSSLFREVGACEEHHGIRSSFSSSSSADSTSSRELIDETKRALLIIAKGRKANAGAIVNIVKFAHLLHEFETSIEPEILKIGLFLIQEFYD